MKTLLVSLFLFIASIASAQEEFDKYIELLRQDLKADKVALITEAMDLTGDASNKFWPIYRDYDHELSKLGDRRVALIKDYAANYTAMTNEKAKSIMTNFFKNQKDRLDLMNKYSEKMEKAIDALTAAKFVQVESQIQSLVDIQLASEMPLIHKPKEAKKEKEK
jgi:hypothetical protein